MKSTEYRKNYIHSFKKQAMAFYNDDTARNMAVGAGLGTAMAVPAALLNRHQAMGAMEKVFGGAKGSSTNAILRTAALAVPIGIALGYGYNRFMDSRDQHPLQPRKNNDNYIAKIRDHLSSNTEYN